MDKINIEEIFLSTLGKKEKLDWYLRQNINLIKYIEVQWPKSLILADAFLVLVPKEKRKDMVGDIDPNRIIGILKKDRPDLYSVLMKYPNWKVWIEKNIENFKKRFL